MQKKQKFYQITKCIIKLILLILFNAATFCCSNSNWNYRKMKANEKVLFLMTLMPFPRFQTLYTEYIYNLNVGMEEVRSATGHKSGIKKEKL